MILVTGATGNVGGATVEALAHNGEPVRAVSREERDWPNGVEGATGDLNRPESLVPALAGAEAMFLLSGYEGMEDLLAPAREAGVRRVVLLSSSSVPAGDMSNAVSRYHIVSERAVKDSGLDWTMLQPNSFMTNTLDWAPQLREGDVVSAPFADVAVATIDPADIGAVGAAALSGPGHEGQSYRLSGPESLLPADRLRILAGVLDRELRLEPQSEAAAREQMSTSMPAEYVDAFMSFFADGKLDESEVLPTVAEVLGREPGSFESWATANADAFR
jgi:uncharacterized protein YbjT (DUF2867 family)